jgi:Neocarzinostatin family/Carboxypeptidase regulatory-like domain
MKWMLRIAVLLLVCAPFALAAPPSSAQTSRSVTVTPDTGLVGGDVVTLSGTGFEPNSPVYYCEGNIAGPFDQSSCGGNIPPSVTADANGAFSVPVTVYRFITPAGGLIDCAQPGATCGMGAANLIGNELIGANTPITFTPQPPATFAIKGSVTGPAGDALAGVAVWAYTSSDTWVGSLQTVTDGNGAYQLDISTNPVTYAVRFGPPTTDLIAQWYDNQTPRNSATPVRFPREFNDPVVTLANQQLAVGGAIAGVVTDGSGTGVSDVTVWAYGPGDTWVGSFGTTTGADGSYRIDGVRPADYKVRFMPPSTSGLAIEWYDNAILRADATLITVTAAGATTTGIDAQLSQP